MTVHFASALVVVAALGCGKGSSNATEKDDEPVSRKTPPIDPVGATSDAAAAAPVTQVVYRASEAADLGAPLMQAVNDAEAKGLDLRVELEAGDYGDANLQIAPLDSPSAIAVELVSIGGPAVLRGAVAVEGGSVAVSGIVLDAPRVSNIALSVRAAGPIEVRDVAIVGGRSRERDAGSLVELTGVGAGTDVTVERLWMVDNEVAAEELVSVTTTGRGKLDAVVFRDVVFAGNRAPGGVSIGFAPSFTMERFVALEMSLGGPWLDVRSPITKVSLTDGVVAAKTLAYHNAGPDAALDEFPKITANGVELRGPAKSEHVDPTGATFSALPAAPADWSFAKTPARALQTPDLAALAGAL